MSRRTPSPVSSALGGLIALAVAVGIGRFVYTPILPPMMAALGMSKSTSGLIASANFAGYLAGALGAARATLPGPRRTWLAGALLLSSATTAGMGLTTSVFVFIILRFVGGIASAMALILSSALVLGLVKEAGRPRLAALHFAGVGIGIAVSATLIAVQHAIGANWASMWQASGAVSLAGAVAVSLLITGDYAPPATAGVPQTHARDPRLNRMTQAYGLFGFGYVITATFLVAIVRATPAVQTLEQAIWIVVGLAAAPSVMVWTFVGRRIGLPAAFATAALTEAAGVVTSVVSPNLVGICIAAVLVGGTFMGLTAMGLMRAQALARGDSQRVMAAMTGAFGIGQIAGPAFAGILSDTLGGFTVPSLVAACGLVLAAWLANR